MSGSFRDEREGEEMERAGVSTELVLCEDPWKIRKKLTKTDVGHSSRLLLPKGCVETHVLPWMGEKGRQVERGDRVEVTVTDMDKDHKHRLGFCYRASKGYYVLNRGWKKLLVNGRELKVGDEIGMLWDNVGAMFHFKVLRRAACDLSFH